MNDVNPPIFLTKFEIVKTTSSNPSLKWYASLSTPKTTRGGPAPLDEKSSHISSIS